jgi:hypothetical protein
MPIGDLYLNKELSSRNLHISTENKQWEGKKVLILGTDYRYYEKAKLGSPYLDLDLSYRHFNNLDQFKVVDMTYTNLANDMPDVIVDENQILGSIFQRMPILARQYVKSVSGKIYFRKNKVEVLTR